MFVCLFFCLFVCCFGGVAATFWRNEREREEMAVISGRAIGEIPMIIIFSTLRS